MGRVNPRCGGRGRWATPIAEGSLFAARAKAGADEDHQPEPPAPVAHVPHLPRAGWPGFGGRRPAGRGLEGEMNGRQRSRDPDSRSVDRRDRAGARRGDLPAAGAGAPAPQPMQGPAGGSRAEPQPHSRPVPAAAEASRSPRRSGGGCGLGLVGHARRRAGVHRRGSGLVDRDQGYPEPRYQAPRQGRARAGRRRIGHLHRQPELQGSSQDSSRATTRRTANKGRPAFAAWRCRTSLLALIPCAALRSARGGRPASTGTVRQWRR